MQEEKSDNNFNVQEITQKMEKIDEMLKRDVFSNPVRQIQENFRNELIEFSNIFHQNLRNMESYIVRN